MSVGDGREGKVRAALHGKGQLGGSLAGLSLPRQIIHIALWPLLEQVMSFICASTSLYLATHMNTPDEVTEQIASGIGVTGYVMWLGFLMKLILFCSDVLYPRENFSYHFSFPTLCFCLNG